MHYWTRITNTRQWGLIMINLILYRKPFCHRLRKLSQIMLICDNPCNQCQTQEKRLLGMMFNMQIVLKKSCGNLGIIFLNHIFFNLCLLFYEILSNFLRKAMPGVGDFFEEG